MKKRNMILVIAMMLALTGCASKEDKKIAETVMIQIENIGSVTIDDAEDIYNIQTTYRKLTDKQKKLVQNYQILKNSMEQLEELILDEEIKKDPTNTITKDEMTGVWKADIADTHRGYFYFTDEGDLYYMASKTAVDQYSFTSDYIIATSFELGEYNRTTREKDGVFYCIPDRQDCSFSVAKDENGKLVMTVDSSTVGGTYTKKGEKVNIEPQKCLHEKCTNMAAITGYSHYCKMHSNQCMECGNYIDEAAVFCLNCIFEALKE